MNKTRMLRFSSVLVVALILTACTQSALRQGDKAMKSGNYAEALKHYELALGERPHDASVMRSLGRVYFHLKDYDNAEKFLKAAQSDMPKDATTVLYLGMLAEAKNDYAGAAEMYRKFLASNGKSKMASQIRGRLLYVQDEKLRQEVAQSVKDEQSLAGEVPQEKTIGVLPFRTPAKASEDVVSLAHGLAASLWYDLSSVKDVQVLERMQLTYLIKELELQEKGFTEEKSGPRLGKLVRANNLVSGSLDKPAADKVSLQSALVNTNAGAYKPTYSADESLNKVLKVQKEMTLAILDSLGIKLSAGQRHALKEIPTDSYDAFLAFSRGVEQMDQGQYSKANSFFSEASRLDRSFDLASGFRAESQLLTTGSAPLGDFENSVSNDLMNQETFSTAGYDETLNNMSLPDDPRLQDLPTTTTGTGTATVSGNIR